MGTYLSQPKTEKESSDETGKYVKCGTSSMQGWRETQEDAHNCIIEYNENMSFFAVYDGHGGHEVAQYCSLSLPDYLKNCESYKKQNYIEALKEAFLGFDATLTKREVISVLKQIAKRKDEKEEEIENSESEDEENIRNLYEEAQMPLEEVIAKYQPDILNAELKTLQGSIPPSHLVEKQSSKRKLVEAGCSSQAGSSNNSGDGICSGSDSSISSSSSSSSSTSSNSSSSSSSSSSNSSSCNNQEPSNDNSLKNISAEDVTEGRSENSKNTDASNVNSAENIRKPNEKEKNQNTKPKLEIKEEMEVKTENSEISKNEDEKIEAEVIENAKKEDTNQGLSDSDSSHGENKELKKPHENGDVGDEETEEEEEEENGTARNSEGKGKAVCKKTGRKLSNRQRNMALLYLLAGQDGSDSDSDDADESFQDGEDSSSNEEEEEDAPDEGENEKNEATSDEEEEEDDEEGYLLEESSDKPGVESGCTAVVALLHGRDLYVANAGDSRCVVCRKGEALDMSLDHKPEDKIELDRIVAAGGYVTSEGRVVGGLNLSRAIGDHTYKKSKKLPPEQQMITALPDVRTLTLDPEQDEFMILACDGIWNFMTSQKVVDFVRTRIEDNDKKLSTICEELLDHCLADSTLGDGTGCDNMTAVLVQFLPSLSGASCTNLPNTACKNCSSDEEEERSTKRSGSPLENPGTEVKRLKNDETVV